MTISQYDLHNKLTNHYINGDKKTNFFQNIIYTIFFLKEIFSDKKLIQSSENFEYNDYIDTYLNINNNIFNKSPSRILCELFLLKFLNENFKKEDEIKILDIGCGACGSLNIFKKYFKNFYYFGCDLKERENWKNIKKKNISLFEYNIGNEFKEDIGKIDFIFSQSVFEHVEYDLSGFKILNNKFSEAKNLHFLPASISFLNYQKHGFRRYNLKSIRKLENELSKNIRIYPIGGKNALKYYFNYNNKTSKKNLILSKLLKHKYDFENNNEYIKFLVNDNLKYYPVFYAIDY